MKKFLSLLLMCVFSIAMAVAQPSGYTLQTGDAQAALTKSISTASSQLKSLKVNFTQEKSSKAFTTPAKSEGTLSYKQPDLLCWSYTSPRAYSIILNKKGAYLKTAKGSTQNKMVGEMAGMILRTINGTGLTGSTDFDAAFYKGKDVLVMLTPKSKRVQDMYKRRPAGRLSRFCARHGRSSANVHRAAANRSQAHHRHAYTPRSIS